MSALISTTDVGSSPDVPDAAATIKWKQYLWVRQSGGTTVPKVYAWNDYATSDTTYLKWQEQVALATGVVTNDHVNASAAIAYSKLSLANGILNADINASAAIAPTKLAEIPYSKLALTGAVLDADLAGSIAEGKLAGSIPIGKLTLTSSAGITNAHINTGAAIDSAKLASIPVGKLTLTESAGITDDHVESSAGISYSKLSVEAGDIPFAALTIGNGDISNLKIDKVYEKRYAILSQNLQASGTIFQVPHDGVQLDGIYRGQLVSEGNQTIVLPDPEKANVTINFSSGYTDGATSMVVDPLPQDLYSGQVVTFAGQQTFVLSANASANAVAIGGKLTAASTLSNDSKGYVYDGVSFRMSLFKLGTAGKVDVRIEGFVPTAGTYSSENLTLTLPSGHGLGGSEKVTVTGMTPTYYNATKATVTNATDTQITYVIQGNDSAVANATGFGLVRRSEKLVNNATGILSDAITVIPSSAAAENKKVLLHLICDSWKGDGQWLIGGIPSHSSFTLQAEADETDSNINIKDLPTSLGYFKVNYSGGAGVGSIAVTVDSTHGLTAAIGDKLMFEGGGLFTFTTAVTSTVATTITGNLTLFDIVNDERGHLIPKSSGGAVLPAGTVVVTKSGTLLILP